MSSNPTQPKLGDQGEGVSFPPEDDAEGHRAFAFAEGQQSGGPEGARTVMADGGEDDTEGHGIRFGEGGPDSGPEGHRLVLADGGEDDTEGHRAVFVDGRPGGQPEAMEPVPSKDGFRALADGGEDDTEGHRIVNAAEGDAQGDGPDGFAAR